MGDFKKLAVWEKAHRLTLAVYRASGSFPKDELYGLMSQIRRAAASIPTNIAEGSGRGGDRELVRFLHIALGSANELEYQLLLAKDLGYLDAGIYQELEHQTLEIQRMLAGLIHKLHA
ncbi:MAG: four helix bundle protein [Chloroflexi bacterium]|nr:four helix bundle protein [Chloroflexota bacterium]MDL1884139.1 four helix bundle protein [Anaerolineae bacterium CFX8]